MVRKREYKIKERKGKGEITGDKRVRVSYSIYNVTQVDKYIFSYRYYFFTDFNEENQNRG